MTRAEKNSGKSAEKAVSSQDDAYSTWRRRCGRQDGVSVPTLNPILTGKSAAMAVSSQDDAYSTWRRVSRPGATCGLRERSCHQGAGAEGSHTGVDILKHMQHAPAACHAGLHLLQSQ